MFSTPATRFLLVLFFLLLGWTNQNLSAQSCSFNVGFRIVSVPNGPRMALWYPSSDAAHDHAYSPAISGSLAFKGTPAHCGRFPVVLFSHGFGGCGVQSVFFTEALARSGYVVAAPDHKDAGCNVDGTGSFKLKPSEKSFFRPDQWTDTTEIDRREDLEQVLEWLLKNSEFSPIVDRDRIGASGHSIGGYTVLGMLGAWPKWRDGRLKAAVLFSPYVAPFLQGGRLNSIDVPVMYQGAQFDLGITPSLRGKKGAYGAGSMPKFYVELRGGSHFEWTNVLCLGQKSVADCIQAKPNARLINSYAISFFDRYLKQETKATDRLKGAGLAAFQKSR